ncbi:TylF/MycF/NovP-related O-methyltransferase [Methylorubrum rhodesianum]|uniref:TylF/MycF/NovP-related O-methyltransferase n=1 Tax=Methylorubrum rhodesianum TaxID=29427 RepID=UPI003CFF55A1
MSEIHAMNDDSRKMLAAISNHLGGSLNVDSLRYLAASLDTSVYVEREMSSAKRFANALDLLSFSISNIAIKGRILEFGVYSGTSVNHIASLIGHNTVYGFDSFEGLPEDWRDDLGKGAFALSTVPPVKQNVILVKGWFDRTLPKFVEEMNGEPIALLHVDCDLYSSTQTIFAALKNSIVPGTIIVFDEYFNFPNWRAHEFLAFEQFVSAYNRSYEYIGLVPTHQQVAVRILK